MLNGLSTQKDDFTVGDLQKILSQYPKNLPVYFGAKLNFNTAIRVEYGDYVEHTVEFDDWLEFKDAKASTQAHGKRGEVKLRPVLNIELKY